MTLLSSQRSTESMSTFYLLTSRKLKALTCFTDREDILRVGGVSVPVGDLSSGIDSGPPRPRLRLAET